MSSPCQSFSNTIYAAVNLKLDTLIRKYLDCLTQLLNNPDPLDFESDRIGFKATVLTQMILPFVKLLLVICTRIQVANYSDQLQHGIEVLVELLEVWRRRLLDKTLYPSEYQDLEKEFSINCSAILLDRLSRVAGSAKSRVRLQDILGHATRSKRFISSTDDKSELTPSVWTRATPVVPPGTFDGQTLVPRHDNDHFDIKDIRIIPTMEEILCVCAPALPGNYLYAESAHWLPSGPDRLLDTHFRLLREDMLASIRSGISSLLDAIIDTPEGIPTGRFRGAPKSRDSMVTSADVDVFVYSNATVLSLTPDRRHGVCFNVAFTPPTTPARFTDTQFWEYNRRLQSDSLVCLIWKKKGDGILEKTQSFDLLLGTVVDSSPEKLASSSSVLVKLVQTEIPKSILEQIRVSLMCSLSDYYVG